MPKRVLIDCKGITINQSRESEVREVGYVAMPEAMYTIKQASRILGVSPQSLYMAIRKGRAHASVNNVNQLMLSVPETYRLLMDGFGK